MKKRTRSAPPSELPDDPQPQPKPFKFLTRAQERAWDVICDNTVVFLLGAPGAGKTMLAAAYANQAVASGRYKHVIHTRPIVEATENLGWLPGDLDSKLGPYMLPLEICSSKTRKPGVEPKVIPIAYLRGVTFENAVCIGDEFQNATYHQIKLYLTRLGNGSKLIIAGDVDQCDVKDSGLARVAHDLDGLEGVGSYTFLPSDSVRHPMVEKMLGRLA